MIELSCVVSTPRARMRSRGKAIGLVSVCLSVSISVSDLSVVNTKNTRSGDLGIWATRKHNESVEIVEKPAPLFLESFGKAHKRPKYDVLLATPINRTPICLVHMRTIYILCR
jgi:hypothetical protein